jgi:hypothetical protein
MPYVSVPVSAEELERLEDLAAREGATVADYLRLRAFGPTAREDPVAILAGREAEEMRDRAAVHFYDRIVDALNRVRRRDL